MPDEFCLILTTTGPKEAAILAVHSYDLPEIIQLPVERGYPPFLEWVKETTGGKL